MHVAYEETKGHRRLQCKDVIPRLCGGWTVEEHQEDAGHGEENEREEADSAEAEGVADLDCVTLHLDWMQVIEHRVHDHVGTVTRAVAIPLAENGSWTKDRTPGLTALSLIDQLVGLLLKLL